MKTKEKTITKKVDKKTLEEAIQILKVNKIFHSFLRKSWNPELKTIKEWKNFFRNVEVI
jgi:hypothetical protein